MDMREIHKLRLAHLRARHALERSWWHVAVQNYLVCYELVEQAGDAHATEFFGAQLSECYARMGLIGKADLYRELV